MQHSDFQTGLDFYTAIGAWRCTDIGTRVVHAIPADVPNRTVLGGTPYPGGEVGVDEKDQRVASLRPQPVVFTGSQLLGRLTHEWQRPTHGHARA